MSVPSGLNVLWIPAAPSDENVLSSAELHEGATGDTVALFVLGSLAATFKVPSGVGARLLNECGLEQPEPGDPTDVPMKVVRLLGSQRLGRNVSNDEIFYLSRLARDEPELSADQLELALLSRRAIQSRDPADIDAFNAAINGQSEEKARR